MDEFDKFEFRLSADERKKLDDACLVAVQYGSTINIEVYVVRKLLYNFLRRLPEEGEFVFSTKELPEKPYGYVYLRKPRRESYDINAEENNAESEKGQLALPEMLQQ